MGRRDGEA
uniref:Uncharacterized protein n=1 Tax=Arundo donax TaxID=35708 RepID=A0A0A8ZID9_ARUDO